MTLLTVLLKKVGKLDEKVEEQQKEIDRLNLLYSDSTKQTRDQDHQHAVEGKRTALETSVAFTALLDHNTEHMAIDQTVIFNTALLNDGNAYNTHTGVFTVPREGLYMFYLAFGVGYAPSRLWLRIVVDGLQKVAGVADTLQNNHDAQGTNMVMLHLHKGDSVWVNVFVVQDVHVYGLTGFTSFSGVLLFEY